MVKSWIATAGFQDIFTVNTTGIGASLIEFGGAATILRTMGEYVISATVAPAAADTCFVGVGVIVMGRDVANNPSTAVFPEPVDDAELPWIYRAVHPLFFSGTGVDQTSAAASVRASFDVKTMRRFTGNQSLGVVVQYVDVAGGPSVTLTVGLLRVLLAT